MSGIEEIGFLEFEHDANRLLRAVHSEGTEYVVTLHGEPVAVLRPFTKEDAERLRRVEIESRLASLRSLASEIGEAWQDERGAAEIVDLQRRG